MRKLFDKILSEKIKTVFNNHRIPYNPADWEKLKANLTGTKRTPIIWLNIAKAASVVLFVGLSTFYVNKDDVENRQSINTKQNYRINKNLEKSIEKNEVNTVQDNNEAHKIYKADNEIVTDSLDNDIKNNLAYEINETESVKNAIAINQTYSINLKEIIAHVDSSGHDSLKQTAQIQLSEQDFEVDQKEKRSKFDFAVAIASMYSYSAQNAEGSINMGGGFTTAYNVSEKVSISSGMLIARQSLDYHDMLDMDYVYANSLEVANNKFADNTTLVGDMASSESKIEFVGIDIPLNIKYKIKRLIVTAGISSLIFVSEKRTYSANVTVFNTSFNSLTNNYETLKTTENLQAEEKSPAFNRFDFAGQFNIAMGYEVPLKKGSLMFEPFLKYPIGEISSANIKIGSGGVSLHYYF